MTAASFTQLFIFSYHQRVWLTDSWDDLFIETALGNYSLPNAHHVDAVLAAAAQYGVRVLMCIESFNLFCTSPNSDCDWQYSVYNTANGGFLAAPQDFFTDPRATAYFQQRLRYLVARYAASPSVFAWEFFNEGWRDEAKTLERNVLFFSFFSTRFSPPLLSRHHLGL